MVNITDPYLYRLAQVESNLDPFARNPNSSAKGLFQVVDATAKQYGVTDPFDVDQQLDFGQRFTEDNRKSLRAALGREPTNGELYLAHQQGAQGAVNLLKNPQAPAVQVVGEDQVVLNGGDPTMTAADFSSKWINKFENEKDGDMVDLIDVEMPDGTVIEGVPANITRQELMDRLERNGLSVVPEKSQEQPKETTQTAPQQDDKQPSSALMALPDDSIMRRLGSAARTGFQGLTFGTGDEIQAGMAAVPIWALKNLFTDDKVSLGEAYDYGLDKARGELDQMRDEYPVQSFLTEVAGSLPTGSAAFKGAQALAPNKMSALSRFAAANPVKAGAGTAFGVGGLYGFNEGEGGFVDRAENALKSGLFALPFGAGGGYVAGKFGSRGASLADDAADNVDDLVTTGFKKDAAQKAKTSALARLTPEQQARSTALEAAGIPRNKQTAAMITRDPKTWQFEQNTKGIAGVGDDIRNRYVQANELIKGKLNEIGVKTGGKATTPFEAGESVVEAVTKKSREMQDDIGKLYGKIREEVGDDVGLAPSRIMNALDEASDNAYADNIVNSMTRKMKRYGIVDKNGAVVEDAALSVKNAEELRKFANTLRGDKQTDHIVSNIIDALDDDVIDTAGTDAFKMARDKARARFAEFETKLLKNISDEKLVADDVLKRTVYGGKVNDLRKLKDSLLSGTDEQIARGAQAWNDLKLQTLQSIIDDSTVASGKMQGSRFSRQLQKIGKERLETVFDPEELLQLKTIEKALEYTTIEVPESVVNYSGTGAANANNALSGIIQRSGIGETMERAAEGFSRIPVVGQVGSPLAAMAKMGGKTMQDAAQRRSVKNVLNPESALRRLADPKTVGRAGVSGGITGERYAE